MTSTKEHRKAIPVGVKLHACLLLLGYTEAEIQHGLNWDHNPALGLRVINEAGEMVPAPNDPRYIVPMRKAAHSVKTAGRKNVTVAGSDIHRIAKVKRLNGETPKRPTRKIPSRGFQKRSG